MEQIVVGEEGQCGSQDLMCNWGKLHTAHNFTANTIFNSWLSLYSSLTSIMLIATFSGFIEAFTAASFNFNDEYKI